MDAINIFYIGATAIILLFFVMFIDKKNHAELAKELRLETQTIRTKAQEQGERVNAINEKLLK